MAARPTPIKVDIRGDESRHYVDSWNKDLKAGILPAFVRESDRLIGEGESAQGDVVLHYLRGIMDRLSLASTGKPCPPYDIYLSDLAGVRACVITDAPRPVMFIGLGLLDMLHEHNRGEDQLAAIIGHERFHIKRHQLWQSLRNSRGEESVADIAGINEAEKAGYNPQALGKFWRILRAERGYISHNNSALSLLASVHPDMNDRIRNADIAMANLQLTRRMSEEMTPIPPHVIAAMEVVRFQSHFDRFVARSGFHEASNDRKIDLLSRYFYQTIDNKDPYLDQLHLQQSFEAVEALREQNTSYRPALRALMNFMTWTSPEYAKRRGRINRRTHYNDEMVKSSRLMVLRRLAELSVPAIPAEELSLVDKVIFHREQTEKFEPAEPRSVLPKTFDLPEKYSAAFWNATTRAEAVEAARKYRAATGVLAKYEPGMVLLKYDVQRVELPKRSTIRDALKAKGHYEFPWHNQVLWALGADAVNSPAAAEENRLIGDVAKELGCRDTRLTGRESVYINKDWYGYHYEDLHFDETGRITGIARSREDIENEARERFEADSAAELYAREYDLEAARVVREKMLVEQTDWRKLSRNFWKFVSEHKQELTPTLGIVPTEYPFIAAFLRKLIALHKKNPKKWGPCIDEFLDGAPRGTYKDGYKKKDTLYGSREKYENPYTLPALTEEYCCLYQFYSHRTAMFRGMRGTLPAGHPAEPLLSALPDCREPDKKFYRDKKTGAFKTRTIPLKKVPPSGEDVSIDYYIGDNHPYLDAYARFRPARKSMVQRVAHLQRFNYKNPHARQAADFFRLNIRKLLGYRQIETPEQLEKLSTSIIEDRNNQNISPWIEAKPLELLSLLERNLARENPRRLALSSLHIFTATHDFEGFEDKGTKENLTRHLRKLMDRQLEINRRIDFRADVPLDTLLQRFCEDHNVNESQFKHEFNKNAGSSWRRNDLLYNIFTTRPHLEARYLAHIKKRIQKLPPAERYRPLMRLMQVTLDDPDYRRWATNAWVESVRCILGVDTNQPEYTKEFKKIARSAIDIMKDSQSLACITKLLEAVNAQKETSFAARDLLIHEFGQKFFKNDAAIRVMEAAISTCSNNQELRAAFLRYITEPLSEDGTTEFVRTMKKHSYKESPLMKVISSAENRFNLTRSQENMIINNLHKNFWALPFELRTIQLDRILFPVHENPDELFQPAVNYVLDKVLPLDRPFCAEAREALLVYMDCCPFELRRVTFSALLATVDHGQGHVMRPGQVLSHVLTRTGAAGGQILQAAHSYLSGLPVQNADLALFRDDLKSSKVDFARPLRWEIFERMDEVLPEDEPRRYIGRVLGCGSTAYVVEEDDKGIKSALKMLRKDVASIGDLHFERYYAASSKLAQSKALYRPLPGMVDHARKLLKISTNGHIAAAQIAYAQSIYDPLSVTVNGKTYSFQVAAVLDAGSEYLRTELVEGEHINDMTAQTHPDKADKCLAIEIAEIHHMLQGRAIDQDRHGGQQKSFSDIIGMFDVCAIPYRVDKQEVAQPETHEKRALGRLLGFVINKTLQGASPVESLINGVVDYEWGSAKSYLVGIKRASLARMDIQNGFSDDADVRTRLHMELFMNAFTQSTIDSDIISGMADTLSLKSLRELAKSAQAPARLDIRIEDASMPAERSYNKMGLAHIAVHSAMHRAFCVTGLGTIMQPARAPANDADITRRSVISLGLDRYL